MAAKDKEAAPIIRQAAKQVPNSAEVQLHAAIILAAVGDTAAAANALDTALRLNPSLGETAAVRALRSKLKP